MNAQDDIELGLAVLAVVRQLMADGGKDVTVTPQQVLDAAQASTDRIAANRAAAETALDEKFKTP